MTAQYLKDGWRPNGPGRCICPHCRATVSTNALARARHKCPETNVKDVDGNSLRVGDTVRKVEFGPNAIGRLLYAIGKGEHIDGWIRVSSSIAWEHPRNYRKVT
jgi:hypothetical protein